MQDGLLQGLVYGFIEKPKCIACLALVVQVRPAPAGCQRGSKRLQAAPIALPVLLWLCRYAQHLREANEEASVYKLPLILRELMYGYAECRLPHVPLNVDEEFYLLSGETPRRSPCGGLSACGCGAPRQSGCCVSLSVG